MDLLRCDGSGAVLHVTPEGCAALAKLCRLAEQNLIGIDEAQEAAAAATYAALFKACALGVMAPGFLAHPQHEELRGELAAVGLGDLLQPRQTKTNTNREEFERMMAIPEYAKILGQLTKGLPGVPAADGDQQGGGDGD